MRIGRTTALSLTMAVALATAACAQTARQSTESPDTVEEVRPAAVPRGEVEATRTPAASSPARDAAVRQKQVAERARAAAVDAADAALTLRGIMLPGAGGAAERPALVVTQPMTAEVEAEWKEDLIVMDKLLNDQTSRASAVFVPQAMGIKLMSIGQSDPMYIEGLGTLFTYRVNVPLAKGNKGDASPDKPAPQPSAWERAKRDLANRGKPDHMFNARTVNVSRPPFDQAELDKLIAAVVKTLPEATNMRHLPGEQFVVVTIVGSDDAGEPMRLTLKASKNDIDQAAKGAITPEEFAQRVARHVG